MIKIINSNLLKNCFGEFTLNKMVWERKKLIEEKEAFKWKTLSVSINKEDELPKLNKLKEVWGINNESTVIKKSAFLIIELPFLLEIIRILKESNRRKG